MAKIGWRERMFSGEFDRAAFIVYFLGAVVPLIGFGLVVDQFALPNLDDHGNELALITALLFTGALTFGAFLALRRLIHAALSRMKRDNDRLAGLLDWSNALGDAEHVSDVLASATERAKEMEEADAGYAFLKSEGDGLPALAQSTGADAERLYTAHAGALEEIVRCAMESGRPAMRVSQTGDMAAASIPLPANSIAQGAIAVLRHGSRPFDAGELGALATLASMSAVALHNADLREAQRNFFSHVTDMLVTAVDTHLGFHRGHGQRVAQLANRLGRRLGLADEELSRLHFAALLHDIGMLKIDASQQMTRAACDKHCVFGHRMLSRIRLWRDLAPIIYHHHEWFDGCGYPDGVKGDAIPRESRIIALCDAVDSMTSEDSYRTPLGLDDALAELDRCAGSQFDPELVAAFRELARDGLIEIGPPPRA
ncbi:MAG TPA: HD domain-containing phosphohydrolase [Myxococcota bacterium]|nr:HD domain-containing phosphohydrolase [Myxococcota bacterium]